MFKPPIHEDERQNFLVGMSFYSFLTIFFLTFYFAITLSSIDQFLGRSICGVMAVTTFITLVFLKRGFFTFACGLFILVAYVSVMFSSIFNQGISSIPMQAVPALFLLILAFMRLRGVLIFGALTLIVIGYMSWLDQTGYYDLGYAPISVNNPGIVSAGIFLATCAVIFIVVKNSIDNSQNLIDARLVAEEQNRIRNKYFATMTHELRTPLNSIIGYSEDIFDIDAESDAEVDPEILEDVSHIHKSGKYLLTLINDILDISKIEADGMDIYVNQFSGLELINEIYATVYPLAKQNGNILVSGLEFDQKISTDRQKLRQILINLLSNSAKFTENGEIHLKFALLDENTYQFEVTDTGIGIPKESLPQLFESYSQVENTVSSFKGTGLGLAITKKLTEVLNGELSVESEVNVGTTFVLILPNLAPECGEASNVVVMAA